MNYKKTILKNGLRVITVPMKDNPTVTVLVLVETGSKYETKEKNGISHFLEHMCFKGTQMRPTAHSISAELDGLGSQYNAFTGQEYTGYYAKSDAKHFKKIFDVVSDIYLNSTFPEAEMEKEKGVIVEEINMYEDMPHRHVQDLFMHLLFGDQPAGWNIAGTRENVRSMTRNDFVEYKKAHYVPKATTVIVAGKVKDAEVKKEIARVFGNLKSSAKSTKQKTVDTQMKPATLVSYKKTDQTHLILGVRGVNTYDKKNPALVLLATILGGGMSSRLFIKLREELGVAYYVRASNDNYTDHGAFQISAGVSNDRVQEVVGEILKECAKLRTELVTKTELDKAKEYLAGNMKLELESSDAWANFYGGQEVMRKKIQGPDELEKKIRRVTAKEIQTVAKQIFVDKNLNLALIGPFEDSKVFTSKLKF
ncbi:MAG: insulinase family protein [Candidatus Pacebacteria bacterium]|nr:insulinase family protein [Candidatus Paceibacterota bacterium]